jgi:hypothetical protein
MQVCPAGQPGVAVAVAVGGGAAVWVAAQLLGPGGHVGVGVTKGAGGVPLSFMT